MSVIPALVLWKLTLSRTRMFSRCLWQSIPSADRVPDESIDIFSCPSDLASHQGVLFYSSSPETPTGAPHQFRQAFQLSRRLPHLPPYLIQTTNLFWLSVLELIKMIWIHCQSNLTAIYLLIIGHV